MAALNQEIYIGSLTEPLFYFDRDSIKEPEGIQSVDLIEEKLPIDVFSPTVYYGSTDFLNKFDFNQWQYALVENGTKIVRFSSFTLTATANDCYTVYSPEEYPPEARIPVSEGNTMIVNWTASGALGSVTVCPNGSLTDSVSAVSGYEELEYVVGEGVTYITLRFSVATAGQSTTYSNITVRTIAVEPDDLRLLPFGTPIWYFVDSVLIYKFYIRSVKRVEKQAFQLDCVSAIGVLDKVYHPGGIYLETPLVDILDEMLDGVVPYTIDNSLADAKLFGYLPYAKARENLHQIMFAMNITILKNTSGDMHFTYLNDTSNPEKIDQNRIYIDGSVEYPAIASELLLTEHSFQYDDTLPYETLIDNTNSKPVENKVYVFDKAPIAVESLLATEGLTVVYAHPNYAIVTGNGILQGIPYYDKTASVIRTNSVAGSDYSVESKDVTLITAMNSENVADRLMTYYSSAKLVKGDIVLEGEKVGHRYSFLDTFHEKVTAYLKKMTIYPSSFIKAACEFVTGYVSTKFGNNYWYHAVLLNPCTLNVPAGTKKIRFTIVGGGDGGSSGLAASEPDAYTTSGGIGGDGGTPGAGGYIREVVINNPPAGDYTCVIGTGGAGTLECSSTDTHLLGGTGTHSSVTLPNGTVYSSADNSAYRSESGVMDLFTGIVYGRTGRDGIKGGNGGRGGSNGPGEPGQDVTYMGITRTGGAGGNAYDFKFNHIDQSVVIGGAGGSGAQAYANGLTGGNATFIDHVDYTTQNNALCWEDADIYGGQPASPTPVYDSTRVYQRGEGGDAGHGGAGRGGWGQTTLFEQDYKDRTTNKAVRAKVNAGLIDSRTASSSIGLKGDPGQPGVIFIYSDKPVSWGDSSLDTPTITNASDLTAVKFTFVNVRDDTSYEIERRLARQSGIWSVIDEQTYATYGQTYTYTDSTAVSGTSYEYRIKAVGHGTAIDSGYSNIIVAGFGYLQLSAPVLSGSQQDYGMRISWTQVTNADCYMVAFKEPDDEDWQYFEWQLIDSQSDCWGEFEETNSKTLQWKVCAGDSASILDPSNASYIASEWSNVVSITAPQIAKCHAPVITNIRYRRTNNWQTQGNMQGMALIYWNYTEMDYVVIERREYGESEWTQVGVYTDVKNQPYWDYFNADHGDIYEFRMKAFKDGWYDSDYSAIYTLTVNLQLSTPTLLYARPYDKNLDTDIVLSGIELGIENVLIIAVDDIDSNANSLILNLKWGDNPWQSGNLISRRYNTNRYAITTYQTINDAAGESILQGGNFQIAVSAYDSNLAYLQSGFVFANISMPQHDYFYWNFQNSSTDPQGLLGGWKVGRDSSISSAPTVQTNNNVMTVSGNGYYISQNSMNMYRAYNKLYLIGKTTKPSRDATAEFGVCVYTGDYQGIGCTYSIYDTTIGTYGTGEVPNPSISRFNNPAQLYYDDGDHIMLYVYGGGSIVVTRIFAVRK